MNATTTTAWTMIADAIQVLELFNVDTNHLCFRSTTTTPTPASSSTIANTLFGAIEKEAGSNSYFSDEYAYHYDSERHNILPVCSSMEGLYNMLPSSPQSSSRILLIDEDDLQYATTAKKLVYYLWNIVGATISIAFVALIAGLFLGLLTLDALDLKIIQRVSLDDDERQYAKALFPIVRKRHQLLVTLLILNALAYETLPIFLDRLVPSWAAILLSTTLILLFGEIIPSAIFTGPKQLMLGYCLLPLTKLFMFILYPIARPLSLILDHIVHGGPIDDDKGPGAQAQNYAEEYDRAELAALVRIQYEDRIASRQRNIKQQTLQHRREQETKVKDDSWAALKREIISRVKEREEEMLSAEKTGSTSYNNNGDSYGIRKAVIHHHRHESQDDNDGGGILDEQVVMEQLNPPLHKTEVNLVEGALQMKTRVVMDVYTPLRLVYAVSEDTILDKNNISQIYYHGYSRILVYRPNPDDPNDKSLMLGYFMTRQLVLIDWDDRRSVSTLPLHRPVTVSPRMNLVDLLHTMQGRTMFKGGGSSSQQLQKRGGPLAFVCARPDIANKALERGSALLSVDEYQGNEYFPIPVHAGFMGIITLEDIMESILQDRVYDEMDLRDRNLAIATLQQWAATRLQTFVRKKKRNSIRKTTPASLLQGFDEDHAMSPTKNIEQHSYDSTTDSSTQLTTESTPLLSSSYSADTTTKYNSDSGACATNDENV